MVLKVDLLVKYMSRVLSTIESNNLRSVWYESILTLKNYNEKSIESRLLKFGNTFFPDYYYCHCNADFVSKVTGNKAQPDILLVSKDFKKWYIVEVETLKKNHTHTLQQIEVFSNPKVDSSYLANYVCRKEKNLVPHKSTLRNTFDSIHPKVLVIFDGYNETVFSKIRTTFPVDIASIEVHKTSRHNGELLRLTGSYPYQVTSHYFLKPRKGDYLHYDVKNEGWIKNPSLKEIIAYHEYKQVKLHIIRIKKKDSIQIKIVDQIFEPDKVLILEKTISNKYFIKQL